MESVPIAWRRRGPFELVAQGSTTVRLTDVLVGDVWVASGQSNMAFEVGQVTNAQAEMAKANLPNVRLMKLKRAFSSYPRDDATVAMVWSACTPESVQEFSAVGYFFARGVQRDQRVPIGVIESSWGGTPGEAWTSLQALSSDASLMPVFAARSTMTNMQAETLLSTRMEPQVFLPLNPEGIAIG